MPNCWRFKMTIPALAKGWGNGKTDIHDERIAFLWWWFARALQKPGWRRISDLSPKQQKFIKKARGHQSSWEQSSHRWRCGWMSQGRCHNAIFTMPHDSPNIQFLGWWIRSWLDAGCFSWKARIFFPEEKLQKEAGREGCLAVLAVFAFFPQSTCLM